MNFAAGFNVFTHQRGEDGLGLGDVLELDDQKSAALGIHCCFPELRGRHFSEAFVALDLIVFFTLLDYVSEELAGGLLFNRLSQRARASF